MESSKNISVVRRAVPQLWGTSNGTFKTDKVGDTEISFGEHSASKKIQLKIIGKESLHKLGVILEFKEKTIEINKILLPMRNIANLQVKPSITRSLWQNTRLIRY